MSDTNALFQSFDFDSALLYEAIVKSTDDYIYIGDLTQNAYLVTENMVKDFSLPGEIVHDLINVWGSLIHPKDKGLYDDSIRRMLEGETDEHDVEYQIRNRKGEYVWVRCRGILKRGENGEPILFAGVVTNLGDKGKVDSITGLFSQIELRHSLELSFERGNAVKGGILLLGLDNFTRVNNLKDHILGDSILRKFAQDIQRLLPENADIYRFDGDQFVILYEEATRGELETLFLDIQSYANRQHEVDGFYYLCTVSAGISLLGEDCSDYLDLVKYAGMALKQSKKKGKNSCTFFSKELLRSQLRTLQLSDLLLKDVRNGFENFSLVYQPLTDANTSALHGAEVLLRWHCEPYGPISPVEFIPILEENELIIPVGKWVCEQAIQTCKEWVAFCPHFVMNINVSYLQMLDGDFCSFVHGLIERYDLSPTHIVLELTESLFVDDILGLQETFRRLREIPVDIAMDDFGTGYSSLGLLAQSPADIVKIDRLFIKTLAQSEFNRSFIGSVVQLCHSVNIHVCMEGVEDKEELDIIRSLGVDYIQGFYFSVPISKELFFDRFVCR